MKSNILVIVAVIILLYYLYRNKNGSRSANVDGGYTGTVDTGSGSDTGNGNGNTDPGNGTGGNNPAPVDFTEAYTVELDIADETLPNRLDLSSLFANYDKSKFLANWGFSSPLFRGETGEVAPLKAGFSHVYSPKTYAAPQMPDASCSKFITFVHSFGQQLRDIAAGMTEGFPAAAHVVNENYAAALNDKAMINELGKRFSSYALMVDNPANGSYRWGGWCLFDEETVSSHEKLLFFLELAGAIQNTRPDSVVNFYGYPSTNLAWHHDMYYKGIDPTPYKGEPLFGYSRVKDLKMAIDGQNGYTKSPLPEGSIYKQSGGAYVLDNNGKRILKDTDFEETKFGIKNKWLRNPHPWMSSSNTFLRNPDGSHISDLQYAVATPYRFILNWRTMHYVNAKTNGFTDITRYRAYPNKLISVDSLLTEHGTFGENSPHRRWISKQQIFFNTMWPLIMGFEGKEFWETGWGSEQLYNPDMPHSSGAREIPHQGTAVMPYWDYEGDPKNGGVMPNDNLSRFKWGAKGISQMRNVFNKYTKNSTLRYLDFNHYGAAIDAKEVIIQGIYQGNNLDLFLFYPFNDPADHTGIDFDFGGTKYKIKLTGRKVKHLAFTGSFGSLEPHQFKALYNNIDGTELKVTGNPEQHNY